jgi:hypothetical protein
MAIMTDGHRRAMSQITAVDDLFAPTPSELSAAASGAAQATRTQQPLAAGTPLHK